jgi:hypothetical protein
MASRTPIQIDIMNRDPEVIAVEIAMKMDSLATFIRCLLFIGFNAQRSNGPPIG